MQNKKTLDTALRITAAVLILISFFLLLIPYDTTTETNVWAVKTGDRVDLDSDYSYGSDNFFGCSAMLSRIGFKSKTTIMNLFITALGLSLAVVVLSIFADIFKRIWTAVFPLFALVFCILVSTTVKSRYSYDTHLVATTSDGYRIWSEKLVSFGIQMVPVLILVALAFVGFLAAGIIRANAERNNNSPEAASDAPTVE